MPEPLVEIITSQHIEEAMVALWNEPGRPSRLIVHPNMMWPIRWAIRWAYHVARLDYPAWWRRVPRPVRRALFDRRRRVMDKRFSAWLRAHPGPKR